MYKRQLLPIPLSKAAVAHHTVKHGRALIAGQVVLQILNIKATGPGVRNLIGLIRLRFE